MQCVVIPGQRFEITKNQREDLAKGDFVSFWQSRYLDSHDPVARTALTGWAPQLRSHPTTWQKFSSKFTWTVLRANLNGTDPEKDATMAKIGLALAKEHAAAVDDDLQRQIGVPGLLSPSQIAIYHWDVFTKFGVSPKAFGGTLMGLPANSYQTTWCEGCYGKKK